MNKNIVLFVMFLFKISLQEINAVARGNVNVGTDLLNSSLDSDFRNIEPKYNRSGKLFTITTLPPTICIGDSQVGVCKTQRSCEKLNGTKLGSEACGIYDVGICCLPVFVPTINEVPVTIRERVSIIKSNSNFGENYFVFPRMNGSCQLRLEFRTELKPPTLGMCKEDRFSVTGSITVKSLVLCGEIKRPLSLSYGNSDSIRLAFSSTAKTGFEVKVQHVDCNSPDKVDDHCLVTYNGDSGQVESFGYDKGYQISGLDYYICVGGKMTLMPTLTWEMCVTDEQAADKPGNKNSFYNTHFFGNWGGTDHTCRGRTSYVAIPGGGTYCGGYFPKVTGITSNLLQVKTVTAEDLLLYPETEYYPISINPMALPTAACDSGMGPQNVYTIFLACKDFGGTVKFKCFCTTLQKDPRQDARPALIGFCLKYSSAV